MFSPLIALLEIFKMKYFKPMSNYNMSSPKVTVKDIKRGCEGIMPESNARQRAPLPSAHLLASSPHKGKSKF
jgi:hypothetical protein